MDRRMRTAIGAVAACGAALALAVAAFIGRLEGASVLGGAVLAVANLWALARIVLALLPEDRSGADAQSRGAWAMLAVVKMLAVVALTWLLMRRGVLSPLPMVVGFLSLPIGIVIGSLVSDRTQVPDPL